MNDSHFASAGTVAGLRSKAWRENSLVLLLYVFLTIILTYPAVFFLRTRVLGGFPEDNFHFLWELWYVAHAIFDLHKSPFFDPDVFVPYGFDLLRNQDLSAGTVLFFSPLTQCFGEVFAYNFLVLASFALTGFGTYLFARELWGCRRSAVLGGIIVGFCSYRYQHAGGHLSIVSTQWIPFFFFYLERTLQRRRSGDAALAGLFFAVSALVTAYYAFMLPLAAVFYLLARCPWHEFGRSPRPFIRVSLVAAIVVVTLLLPFAIPYAVSARSSPMVPRPIGEAQAFAASLADYFIPNGRHLLFGKWVQAQWRSGPNGLWTSEWQVYIGIVALALALVGVMHPERKIVRCLLITAAGCLLFSFGPGFYLTHPPPLGEGTNEVRLSPIVMPVRFIGSIIGFNQLRAWARLGFFVELMVGVLAAGGLQLILRALDSRRRSFLNFSLQWIVTVLFAGLVVLDSCGAPMGMSLVAPRAVDQWLAKQPGKFAFMEYPISRHAYGGPAIYSTRLTGKRIIMGNAQNPPNLAFWETLSAFPSPSTLDLLYRWGTKYVVVDESLYRAGVSFWKIYQTWSSLESAIKASPRLQEVAVLDEVHLYQLDSGVREINGKELLANGNFEQGNAAALPGWQIIGRPNIDRTGKYSLSADAACAITPKNFLVSQPVIIEAGQCYRTSVRFRSDPPKLGTLRVQLKWSDGNEHDLSPSAPAIMEIPSAPQWQHPTMMIQAPIGSKYATVSAAAGSGRVWIDNCSLKKLANDCEPVLFATPNQVSVTVGQPGRAAISWNTYHTSEGRVTLITDGGAETVFADGRSGLQMLDGIKPGTQYQFRLYTSPDTTPAKSVEVTAVEKTATITADPNPVPAGSGLGRTQICWATLTGETGEVYVSQHAGPEHLFASGATGCTEAHWIAGRSEYEFRLYTNSGSRRLVAKVRVTR